MEDHPFLDALSESLSYTPFSPEKIMYIKKQLEAGVQVSRLEIDISDICNFRCPGCTFKYSQADAIMPFENIRNIARELKRLQITHVTLAGGGDPTQYRDNGFRLPDVTELFADYGIDIFLITNGYDLTVDDMKRILPTVKSIRISYYNFIAPGEPEQKNIVVGNNIKKLLQLRDQMSLDVPVIIGNLVSYNKLSDYLFTLELANTFGTIVTPRPLIHITKFADGTLDKEKTRAILDRTLQNYEKIYGKINVTSPVAVREFLERVLAYNLHLEKKCTVTELGLVGKLRASGDLYRCGQLSAVPKEKRKHIPDEILFSNVYADPRTKLLEHLAGVKELTKYQSCPACRETINNIRLNRFDALSDEIKAPILEVVMEAYKDNQNLGGFW